MDRYLAWLITDYLLNRHEAESDPEYVPQIFQPSSPKLVFWGFVIVIIIALALAVIGYPIRETAAALL